MNINTISLIADMDYAVDNITQEHKEALKQTISLFFDSCPTSLVDQLILADTCGVVWVHLPDSLIEFLCPTYYDVLNK